VAPEHAGGLAAAGQYGEEWMSGVIDGWFRSEHSFEADSCEWVERLPGGSMTTPSPSATCPSTRQRLRLHRGRRDRNSHRPGKLLHRAMQARHPSQITTHQQESHTVFAFSAGSAPPTET
jgi:hypothetical protein